MTDVPAIENDFCVFTCFLTRYTYEIYVPSVTDAYQESFFNDINVSNFVSIRQNQDNVIFIIFKMTTSGQPQKNCFQSAAG